MRLMTSLGGVVLASVFLIAASAPPGGQLSGVNQSSNATAVPNRRVHTVGDVWMSIGSDGRIGGQYEAYGADPDSIAEIESSFEFPGGSYREHLYGSGLWIGGLVGGVDTVVMSAMFASSGPNPVFTPTKPMETYYDSARGHQYFVAQYADTAMNFNRYPADRSLGVEIRQTSHAFESRPYDRFVIVEYLIRNISRQTIYKAHVGFFADPDVFHELRSGQPEGEASDDITGFLRERGIAYTIDNDGDAANVTDSLFSRNWCPSGFGLAPVMMDPLPACTSFNWRATNFGNLDWGPSRVSAPFGHFEDPALPYGMNGMYRTMANAEIDYDQIEAAIDKRDEGWRRPAIAQADHVANGLDTRWVLSYSFGNLAPYDSLRIVMAYVIGDSIHTTPGRYPDPYNPDTFFVGLDFTDLRRNVDLARWAWGHNFSLDGAAPLGLRAEIVADQIVRVSWQRPPTSVIRGFRIYRRQVNDSDWAPLIQIPDAVLTWHDSTVLAGVTYEYFVTALDGAGIDGVASESVVVLAGQPPLVPGLRGENTPEAVGLTWTVEELPGGFSETRFLNLYRRTETDTVSQLYHRFYWSARAHTPQLQKLGPTDPASAIRLQDPYGMLPFSFVDNDVTPGVTYWYQVSVTNSLGIESKRSGEISVTPMQFDRRGIVLIHMTEGDGATRDSVLQFYGRWAEDHGFDTVVCFRGSPPAQNTDTIPSMDVLSHYQCAILVMENMHAIFPVNPLSNSLERYISNSGRVMVIQRNGGSLFGGWPPVQANAFLRRFFGIRTLWPEEYARLGILDYRPPFTYLVARFEGAESCHQFYPDVEGDSLRGWDSQYIQYLSRFVDSIFAQGNVPAVGALDSLEPDTEILYRYNSAYDTSMYHNKPIAVRRITDSSAAILFNFPLSLMKHEQAWQALTQAVADLGIDTVNYWLPPTTTTRSMIEWLYGNPASAPDPAWDINHDGIIDIRDVVEELRR